jgi:hypothetical protein
MYAVFRRLVDADVSRLTSEPALIADYVGDDHAQEGFGPFADFDADKAWHAIHFLLTGSAWEGDPPLNFIATGGTPIGEDLGYGPARALSSAEVKILANALEPLSAEQLSQRFDPEAMMAQDIYPAIWDRPVEEDDTLAYVVEIYTDLRQFIIDTAREGNALLIVIS